MQLDLCKRRCEATIRGGGRRGQVALLADQLEPGAEPGLQVGRIGALFSWRTTRRSSAVRLRISASTA